MTDDDDIPADVLALLAADHEDVRQLFAEYDELVADAAEAEDRLALARDLCAALTAHATAEEEIFYPALRAALEDEELIEEAESAHASARALIGQIRAMDPADDAYDASVRVLGEAVLHHLQEEEGGLFLRVREAGLDLQALGERVATRRQQLLAALDTGDEEA